MKKIKEYKREYVLALFVIAFFAFCFVKQLHWTYPGKEHRKLLAAFVAIVSVTVLPVLAIYIESVRCWIGNLIDSMKRALSALKTNYKRVVFFCLELIAINVCTYFLQIRYAIWVYGNDHGLNGALFWALTINCIFILYKFRKYFLKDIAATFAILALTMGVFTIIAEPPFVGVSWDDEVHYRQAVSIVSAFDGYKYAADEKIVQEYGTNIQAHIGYDRNSRAAYMATVEDLYASEKTAENIAISPNVSLISYIPSAIGIIVARALGLSFTLTFMFGKLFNLFVYVGLIYAAIKNVKYGKSFFAVLALSPTIMFLASAYAYDNWLMQWYLLGLSYFINIICGEKVTFKNKAKMVAYMAIGCIPKAVYFPILFPLLFIKGEAFENKREKYRYWALIIIAGLLLLSTFLIPTLLIRGAVPEDTRAIGQVSGATQVDFIKGNPVEVLRILLLFIWNYIKVDNWSLGCFQLFAYLGNGTYATLITIILFVALFLDQPEERLKMPFMRLAIGLGVFGALFLVVLALYITFTEVGATTVAGVQMRYMLPLLPLIGIQLTFGGRKLYSDKYRFVLVAIMGVIYMSNMYTLLVLPY